MLQTHPCAARSSYQRFPSPDKQTAQWLTQEQRLVSKGISEQDCKPGLRMDWGYQGNSWYLEKVSHTLYCFVDSTCC